jgi:hypothetical protein
VPSNLKASVLALGTVALLCNPAASRAAFITELMASNDTVVADDDGDFSDWLEIHNETAATLDLGGYYLTDDPADLIKWRFPSVTIAGGGYLLVWASDKNRTNPAAPLHLSFKLSATGEYLALVEPDGATIAHAYAPTFPAQETDLSHGLAADLVTERCFSNPTPGAINDETIGCGLIEALTFSVERGFFSGPFTLALSTSTPGAVIRYTTDASEPSATHGTVYGGPIPISTTTAVRAMAFGPTLRSLPSVTHTYLFLDDVIRQSEITLPPEYPDKWTAGTGADYDMDPTVVEDPAYSDTIKDDLRAIPTMSIVTDVANLFDPSIGIYQHVTSKGEAWERPVSMEFFDREDGEEAQINCGLRIQGAQSRENSLRKHNLRLLFKGIYGPTKLEFALFPDSGVDRFDTVVLTAGHGNSWQGGFARALYLRDTWAKDTQLEMGQVASHSTYVHLYLNGIYWGLYRPTERPTGAFMAEHFGGDKEDYDTLRSNKVSDGDKQSWNTLQELANQPLDVPANYAALLEYLDVENLIDYMLLNFYASNADWDFHNWYAGRKREPGAGYRFFSWDAEDTLGNVKGNRTGVKFFDDPSDVYNSLRRESREFQVLFGDHAHRHLFNDGALTPDNALERLLRRAAEIDRAIVGESARWGDNRGRDIPFTRDVDWIKELNWQRLSFFPRRREILLDQLRSKDLYPNVTAPSFDRHGGLFAPGAQTELGAPAGILYFTDDGADPRLPGGAVSPTAQVYLGPIPLAGTIHLAARAQVGLEWSALVEADFVEDTPVRITELMFHAPVGSQHDYVELTNTGTEPVDLTGFAFTNGIDFTFSGSVLAPGAQVLVVADTAAFTAHYGAGKPVAGQYAGGLSNGGEKLRLEDAAGNAFVDLRYDDRWVAAADGGGRSLVARDPSQDATLFSTAQGWRGSGAQDGSPGSPEPRLCSNGLDDDGDGDVDAADPGCADGLQDDENPACDDGLDNDGDGAIDTADDGCTDASSDSEEPASVDPFLCYSARENAADAKFEDVDAELTDAVTGSVLHSVRKPASLCLPGSPAGADVADGETDLVAYQIRGASGEPRPAERAGLLAENTFGPIFVDTGKADLLLIPASHATTGSALAPTPGSHAVDSYKCYRVKLSKSLPRYFPPGAEQRLTDAFEDRQYRLKKPKRLCSPVSIDGSVIENGEGHMMCYPARRNDFSPVHTPRTGISVADRFGDLLLDTRREAEICVPTRIVP